MYIRFSGELTCYEQNGHYINVYVDNKLIGQLRKKFLSWVWFWYALKSYDIYQYNRMIPFLADEKEFVRKLIKIKEDEEFYMKYLMLDYFEDSL